MRGGREKERGRERGRQRKGGREGVGGGGLETENTGNGSRSRKNSLLHQSSLMLSVSHLSNIPVDEKPFSISKTLEANPLRLPLPAALSVSIGCRANTPTIEGRFYGRPPFLTKSRSVLLPSGP